jgi:hypothetical protein
MERAMLADYVARLEKQLDAVETRARDAEADAKNARSALTEALLEKARDQKSAKDRNGLRTSPATSELVTLRAELETARQDRMRHESQMDDVREATAQELRVEYEQKFHTARERMAQEFQKSFAGAQDKRAADRSLLSAPVGDETRSTRTIKAASASAIGTDGRPTVKRKPLLVMVAAAFAGGFALGWSALPSRNAEIIGKSIAPTTAESRPPETTSAAPIESQPAVVAPHPLGVPEPSPEMPAAASETRATGDEPAEPLRPDASPPSAEAYRGAQERNAALSLELDALQQRLDRANARAGSAESALKAERERTAERSRRARADDTGQGNQAAPAAQQPATGQVSRPAAPPPGPASPFPAIE